MKNTIKAMVIDDEPLAIIRIANLLQEVDRIELINESASGEEAIEYLKNNEPDLIFIDIDLNGISGFEVISKIKENHYPHIIFVSAHKEFALEAFNSLALDYLLKPYKDERFFKSIDRILKLHNSQDSLQVSNKINQLITYVESQNFDNLNSQEKKIPIKCNEKVILLKANTILYILASGHYSEVYVANRKYLIRESLKLLNDRLPKKTFFRIHRSRIINLDLIEEIIISNYREIDVKMKDAKLFRVSPKYKNELLNIVGLSHDS